MPMKPNEWRRNVPDAGALAKRILNQFNPQIPWAYSGADADFTNAMAGLYSDLWTECFNASKKSFCERLGQFINWNLLVFITDVRPNAFCVADKILTDAGLARAKDPMPNYAEQQFYAAAGPKSPHAKVATVLDTYWT